jgi:hypothetical protein
MMATAIPAAINPYSMAVAPSFAELSFATPCRNEIQLACAFVMSGNI